MLVMKLEGYRAAEEEGVITTPRGEGRGCDRTPLWCVPISEHYIRSFRLRAHSESRRRSEIKRSNRHKGTGLDCWSQLVVVPVGRTLLKQ